MLNTNQEHNLGGNLPTRPRIGFAVTLGVFISAVAIGVFYFLS